MATANRKPAGFHGGISLVKSACGKVIAIAGG
jgi:hypothetical protein